VESSAGVKCDSLYQHVPIVIISGYPPLYDRVASTPYAVTVSMWLVQHF